VYSALLKCVFCAHNLRGSENGGWKHWVFLCLSILITEARISYQYSVLQSSVPSVGVKLKHKINDND